MRSPVKWPRWGRGSKTLKSAIGFFPRITCPAVECRYCLGGHQSVCDLLRTTHFDPGGFAEYIRVPKINVELGTLRIPDTMTFDEGSFIEPLACVVRAQRFAGVGTGQTVLVIGSGISGLLHVQLAAGARRGADYCHRYQRLSPQSGACGSAPMR